MTSRTGHQEKGSNKEEEDNIGNNPASKGKAAAAVPSFYFS
jgi:hypothetical protein